MINKQEFFELVKKSVNQVLTYLTDINDVKMVLIYNQDVFVDDEENMEWDSGKIQNHSHKNVDLQLVNIAIIGENVILADAEDYVEISINDLKVVETWLKDNAFLIELKDYLINLLNNSVNVKKDYQLSLVAKEVVSKWWI